MRHYYLSVVTGRRTGFLAALTRILLSLGSVVYAFLHGTRRLLYRIGIFKGVRLPCRVISVGNLTTGGTGKTPFVEYLARWFSRKGLRTAILARGYGKMADGRDDEELIDPPLDNVRRFTGTDRVALARKAIAEFRPQVILLDDGFQHYQIARDLDLLLVDALDPFANGRLIPRGFLRERIAAARRADAIVLTRADQAAPDDLAALRDRLSTLTGRPVLEAHHKPSGVRTLWNRKLSGIDWIANASVLAFCGIGNPEAFRRTLVASGAKVLRFVAFDDHHRYTAADLQRLNAEAQEFMAETVVTTEKDATKLRSESFEKPLVTVRIEFEIARDEPQLEALLLKLVQQPAAAEAPTR